MPLQSLSDLISDGGDFLRWQLLCGIVIRVGTVNLSIDVLVIARLSRLRHCKWYKYKMAAVMIPSSENTGRQGLRLPACTDCVFLSACFCFIFIGTYRKTKCFNLTQILAPPFFFFLPRPIQTLWPSPSRLLKLSFTPSETGDLSHRF